MFIASEYGVGAYLPEHQVWTLGGDTLVEACEHVDGTFGAGSATFEPGTAVTDCATLAVSWARRAACSCWASAHCST